MRAKVIFIFVLMSLFCSSCGMRINQNTQKVDIPAGDDLPSKTGSVESDLELKARTVLIDFHAFLNHGNFDQAAELYGGSYEVLQGYNPSINEENKEGLLQAACEFNGFMCLETLSVALTAVDEQGEFVYEVEFANKDSSKFILGPCCGASEEEMPPKSSFAVHVHCEDEETCLVMDLPPYVP